ncbi:uncharacterized protein LOC134273895 isoform X5 [Saccostrea cucullata]|uniref:uncharacterized protein LOC134273895 isoform X5 n=1 Tax=Saccostrea cuccullata TaxID=36930 RepID=UPI002ED62207
MATFLLTRLALWCYCLQGTTIPMRSNWCMHSDGSMTCCTSYFEEDGDCYETTFPILETSTAKVLGTSHSSQLLEASSNAASKLETFFENLQLRHWLVICSVFFLIVFVFFVIIGTVRRRNKRKREQKQRLDTGSGYLGTPITPHSSTRFLNVSFQSRPIDDPPRRI